MKSKLNLIPTRDMSREDWLAYRTRGIGASEVGTILGVNPYKCSAQLFYEKLGENVYTVENMAMFLGKETEDLIANLWQYWDGDEVSMINNFRAGKIVRRCQRVNAYVNNPDFPWLFVSLDRKINKAGKFEHLGGANGGEGALELKTIAGHEANKWEAGIPPAYVIQVQTQLMVCEFDYGEMAILKDGRQLEVIPFEKNEGICETIKIKTREFWDKVLKGRELKTREFAAKQNFNFKEVEEIRDELTTLEPPPDGSEAFAKYLKERYQIAAPGEQEGEDEHLTWACKQREISEKIKELETEKRLYENNLKNVLRDGADKITFKDLGYVSWKADVNKIRRFSNKVKSI